MSSSRNSGDRRLDEVLAAYLEEAETVAGRDHGLLQAIRGRYVSSHPELASGLKDHFEGEDAVGGRLGGRRDAPPKLERHSEVTLLGQGGMGVVYKAFDRELKRWVALKVPSLGSSADDEARRLRTEAESMARLRHPNIVRVLDVSDHEGRPVITMELASGGTLEQHVDRIRKNPRAIAKLMADVARGVHHAHQRSILHRDLKPSNILLDSDEDGTDHPYVSDFGLAKPIDAGDRHAGGAATTGMTSTRDGQVVGTISYMSPEQACGRGATTLSDVYGLGAILYVLLTGRPPFRGASATETLARVRDPAQRPASPRALDAHADRTLEAICMKCLERDPERRYSSAEDVAKDLDRWLDDRPTEARPPRLPGRAVLWSRRNPVGVGLAIALLALATLTALSIADRLGEPRRAHAMLARQRAEVLGLRLHQFRQAVAVTAADPRLIEPARARDVAVLQAFIEETGERSADPDRVSPFESWRVIDARDGEILARWPSMFATAEGVDFRGRDFFRGLAQSSEARGAHVSRVYRSIASGLYEFGVSAWILDGGTRLGVVVASVTTSPRMGFLPTERDGLVTSLLARRDSFLVPGETGTPPAGASDYLILLHPGYERGAEPVWFPENRVQDLRRGHADDYDDPAASLGGEAATRYGGRWLAAFAPVEGSPFILMVQQRPAPPVVADARIVATTALVVLLLLALAIQRHRHRSTAGQDPLARRSAR